MSTTRDRGLDAAAVLRGERCVVCQPGVPKLTAAERASLKVVLPDWSVVKRAGIPRLERVYRVADFAAALAFAQRIGEVAEVEGHHPLLTLWWGRVTVSWWTHSIAGLHRNDAVMAAKTDAVYEAFTDQSAPAGNAQMAAP